jgi:hypothetical protein
MRTALLHPLVTAFAHLLMTRLTLGLGQITVVVGIKTRELFTQPDLNLGDDHGSAFATFTAGATATTTAAHHRAASATAGPSGAGTTLGAGITGGVELGAADRAVVVGVQTFEALTGHFLVTGFAPGLHFLAGDGTVAVGVQCGQARHTARDELGLADTAVAVGVGRAAMRTLLCNGDTAGSDKGESRQAPDDDGLVHGSIFHVSQPSLIDETAVSCLSVAEGRKPILKGPAGRRAKL